MPLGQKNTLFFIIIQPKESSVAGSSCSDIECLLGTYKIFVGRETCDGYIEKFLF